MKRLMRFASIFTTRGCSMRKKSINYFKFYRDFNGNLLDKELKHVYCVIKGRDELLYYKI